MSTVESVMEAVDSFADTGNAYARGVISGNAYLEARAALEAEVRALAAPNDDVFEALDFRVDQFRSEGGSINKGKLRAAIKYPNEYLPTDHWLRQPSEAAPVVSDAPTVTNDPMNYKGMFLDAVQALAEIDEILGLPADGCNDPQVTVSALKDYINGIAEVKKTDAPFTIEDVREWIKQGQARAASPEMLNGLTQAETSATESVSGPSEPTEEYRTVKMGEACANCHGSGTGEDGRPCPGAPHPMREYKLAAKVVPEAPTDEPKGWISVPAEPTAEMVMAAKTWADKGFDWPAAVYRAMVRAAAPTLTKE